MFRTMHQFSIYTEDVNRETVEEFARSYFDGYTVSFGTGFYDGSTEGSLCVTVICESAVSASVRSHAVSFAQRVNAANNQQSCLVTEVDIRGAFIRSRPDKG